jgi:exopolysaccharide production protein ExoQ
MSHPEVVTDVATGEPRAGDVPWLRLILLAVLFFLTTQDIFLSLDKKFDRPAGDLVSQTAKGNPRRQFAFLGLGALGIAGLLARRRRRIAIEGLWPSLFVFFVAWIALSFLWSIDGTMSAKRILQLGILGLCAFTMATRYSEAVLPAFVYVTTLGTLLVGLGAELALGTFSLGDRFAGTQHPNAQALNCALLVLSATALAVGAPRARLLLLRLTTAFALGALLLTRSRTALTSLLLALTLRWIASLSRWRAVAAIASLAWVGALVLLVGGDRIAAFASEGVELGRAETDFATFQGRTGVWQACLEYARQRPVLGHGFGAFWTPDHIQAISSSLGWGVPDAHSAYVECLLNLGLVGVASYVLLLMGGARAAFLRARALDDPGSRFIFSLMLFVVPHGVLEAGPSQVSLPMFILTWGFLSLLSTPLPEVAAERPPRARSAGATAPSLLGSGAP